MDSQKPLEIVNYQKVDILEGVELLAAFVYYAQCAALLLLHFRNSR